MKNYIPDFTSIFQHTPGNYLVIKPNSPDFTIIAANDQYLKSTITRREDIVGRNITDIFIGNPNNPFVTSADVLKKSFETVIREKRGHEMEVLESYFPESGQIKNGFKFWLPKNTPVLNDDGQVSYIIHSIEDVTERLKAEKEVVSLKLKTYSLFMQAPVAICIQKGSDYTIELANNIFLELIGKNADAVGKPLLEILPEIKDQGFIELMDEVRLKGKPYYANEIAATLVRDGKPEIVYVNFVYQPLIEADQTISGIMVIATNVTEQVIARKKVEENEQQLQNLISEAHVATALYFGPDMIIQYANEEMLKVWGKNSNVIGQTLRTALPELEDQRFHQLLTEVFTTGRTYWGKEDKVSLIVDNKLQDFYFNFSYKALRNADGEIYAILNTAIDVTEQVIYKNELIRSEERLRLAVEAARLGTYEYEAINHTIIHSPRTAEIFGYDPNVTLSHETILNAIYQPDLPIRNKAHEEALKTGELYYQVQIIHPDKSLRWIQVNGKLIVDKDVSEYTIGTVMDITDEKRNAEIQEQKIKERTRELEETNELLKQSNIELEQIANAAGHDLKEPLRKIRTFNQLIKKESYEILSDRSKNHLDKSSEAAERMASFLDALLEYTELKKPEQFTSVDLNSIVVDVLNDLELVIGEKNATLNAETLPAVKGIPHQLYQLFYNLINNALKFSKADVPPVISISTSNIDTRYIEQHISLRHGNKYIAIIVKDNGIGFNEKESEQIFTIFKRLHSKSAYKGTGIGLALCKRVAINHGGDIFASSTPGDGATFHIILPELGLASH